MKNLEGQDLKNNIKDNILYSLNNAKNPDIKITFIFNGIYENGKSFEYKEHISYFAGFFHFKGVSLNTDILSKQLIINLIIDNFRYDYYKFIACVKKIGKSQCHGHGEYWGTDTFTFVYTRL